MIFGYSPFGTFLGTNIVNRNYQSLELSNCKFKQLKGDNDYLPFDKDMKQEWSFNTFMFAKFEGDLEAGNIKNKGIPIENIRFKRRKMDELTWQVLKDFAYSKNKEIYELLDMYTESGVVYEYGVVPVTGLVEGNTSADSILSMFSDAFVIDKDNFIKLKYNFSKTNVEYIQRTTEIETLGGQYPYSLENDIDYRQGKISVSILSDESIDDSNRDLHKDICYYNKVMDLLRNKRLKLIKDSLGGFYLAKIKNIRETTNRPIFTVEFDFIEMANAKDIQDLKLSGLEY